MKISDVSIKNPVFAWMLMLGLMVFGALSFQRLGISQLPDVDLPQLNVSVNYEGAAPEVIENSVIDPLENALMTVEGVKSLSSSSKRGSGSISLEFEFGKDINVALQEVQAKLSQAQRRLPKEVEAPTVSKTNPEDQPILWLALTSEGPFEHLNRYAQDYLKDQLSTVPGVADVMVGGAVDSVLTISLKPEALKKYNMTAQDVMDALQNENQELPGGVMEVNGQNVQIRTLGEMKNLKEFSKLLLHKRGGVSVPDPRQALSLDKVAQIEWGLAEVQRVARFNGTRALGFGIRKQRGTNAVAVGESVRNKIKELETKLPTGMKLSVNFDSTQFIKNSVKELNKHLVLAVILTALVCWGFLGSWSVTLNVLLAIPTSLLGAFIGLAFFGFTLNTFTLLGLTLAIGIVVDDAIMVLENIFRYNEKGHSRVSSAILGSREIAFAAMAATFAVIAIFLPVIFMKGLIGAYFLQFGVAISLAVFLSLVESLTLTPMRCASFVSHGERSSSVGKGFERALLKMQNFYHHQLQWVLRHPWKILIISLMFSGASFYLVVKMKKELIPVQDQSLFTARLSMPVGTSLKVTDDAVKKVEDWFLKRPEVLQIFSSVGGFGGGGSDGHSANFFVTLKPRGQRGVDPESKKELSQQEFMAVARKALISHKPLKVILMDMSQRGFGGGRGFPVEVAVKGGDWSLLVEQSESLVEFMKQAGIFEDVESNYKLGAPEMRLLPKRDSAALFGVSMVNLGKTVGTLMGGVTVGQWFYEGKKQDIRLQLQAEENPLENLKSLQVNNNRGNLIPLRQLVDFEEGRSVQTIYRLQRQRALTITANLAKGISTDKAFDVMKEWGDKNLKPGYILDQTGNSQSMKESFASLTFALILGILVAYMILGAQFNSFLDPISVLVVLPFSVAGAFIAMLLLGESLNVYSFIGLLLLMGIAKKNSILLVEFANHCLVGGAKNALLAMQEAGPVRLRPILMTSIATIAAAIPSAMAMGEGAETMRPMAITLIGGVLLSTILTLYVVPCVYILLDLLKKRSTYGSLVNKAFEEID